MKKSYKEVNFVEFKSEGVAFLICRKMGNVSFGKVYWLEHLNQYVAEFHHAVISKTTAQSIVNFLTQINKMVKRGERV